MAPALLWTALVFVLSGTEFGGPQTRKILYPLLAWWSPEMTAWEMRRVHRWVRTAAHIGAYGVLALVWRGAFQRALGASAAVAVLAAFALSVGCAIADEARQRALPGRTGKVRDIGLDALSAAGALALRESVARLLQSRQAGK
jgi:VanZ family protein